MMVSTSMLHMDVAPSTFLGSSNPLQDVYVENIVKQRVLEAQKRWELEAQTSIQTQIQQGIAAAKDAFKAELKGEQEAAVRLAVEQQCGTQGGSGSASRPMETLLPRETMGGFAVAMARTPKENFTSFLDPGVPLDPVDKGTKDVLLIYTKEKAVPRDFAYDGIPLITDSTRALENCDGAPADFLGLCGAPFSSVGIAEYP